MFKKHLNEAGKSYWRHFKFAFIAGFILNLIGILIVTLVSHYLLPASLKKLF